jgi:hypothetical protein
LAFFVISVIYTFVTGCSGFTDMLSYPTISAPSAAKDNTTADSNVTNTLGLRLLQFENSFLDSKLNSSVSNESIQTNSSLDNSTSNKTSNATYIRYSPHIHFNIFTYTLPFVAFIFDHSAKRLMNLPEKTIFILIKLGIIVYYLGSYVLALQSPGTSGTYVIVANVNFLVFPMLHVAYAFLLRQKLVG